MYSVCIQCSLNIVEGIEEGHLDTAGDTAPGCLIEDIINTLAGLHAGVEVLDVALDELIVGVVEEHIDVLLLAGREVVKAAHLVTEVQDGLAEVGADEACSTCHEEQGVFGEL